MSCQHGNAIGGCDICDEIDEAWKNGEISGRCAAEQRPASAANVCHDKNCITHDEWYAKCNELSAAKRLADTRGEEFAELERSYGSALDREQANRDLYLTERSRAEALEAERKELEKQEPIYQIETDGWFDVSLSEYQMIPEKSRRIVYTRPLPAPDLQKQVDELEAVEANLCELHNVALEENAELKKKLAEAEQDALSAYVNGYGSGRVVGIEEGKRLAVPVIEQAHMAGQYRDGAGVDPSAYDALAWIESTGKAMLAAAPKPKEE